jgi:hypothetical protein
MMKLTEELKKQIDDLTYEQLLFKVRYASFGDYMMAE